MLKCDNCEKRNFRERNLPRRCIWICRMLSIVMMDGVMRNEINGYMETQRK